MESLRESLLQKPKNTKKRIAITSIVVVVAVAVAIALVLGLVVFKTDNNSQPRGAASAASRAVQLPQQKGFSVPRYPQAGKFLVVQDKANLRSDGSPRTVARNYGKGWETVPDLDSPPVTIIFRKRRCVFRSSGTPNRPFYEVRQIDVPDRLKTVSAKEHAARLLTQATFGGTLKEIQDTASKYGNDFLRWIEDQMNIEATSLTSYYRKRTSPRRAENREDGVIFTQCDVGSRWHRQVFTRRDNGKKLRVTKSGNRFVLHVDGMKRGDTATFLGKKTNENINGVNFPATFSICDVPRQEAIGSNVEINSGRCMRFRNRVWANPKIEFTSNRPSNIQYLKDGEASFQKIIKDAHMLSSLKKSCDRKKDPNTAYIRYKGEFYQHDPRLRLIDNTLDNPSDVSSVPGATCPAVKKNFMNEDFCQRRASCNTQTISSAPLPLNLENLKFWFTQNKRYVYFFTGMRLEDMFSQSPCNSGRSRWQKVGTSGSCPGGETAIERRTKTYIREELAKSTDRNAFVRDVTLASTRCNAKRKDTIGSKILVGQQCYQHVHPNAFNVYDATAWRDKHPGGKAAIAQWTNRGYNLQFPGNHPMMRWADNRKELFYVGRYGDTIDFKEDLIQVLKTPEMAAKVNALSSSSDFEVCGAPGEVNGTTAFGNLYRYGFEEQDDLEFGMSRLNIKSTVWTNSVFKAPDQLRQRVAWTLANILTLSDTGLRRELIDIYTSFYDIFVRNAFGNYRDVLRQVSYHPMMGDYLSYRRNRKFAESNAFPDENYAREIMQLYSVGLWKLNDDGTRKLDADGNPVPTYTNDDIVDMARIWTGFDRVAMRPNIHQNNAGNYVDLMVLRHTWRDVLPKTRLDSGYIGDGYPICNELREAAWVNKGAVYTLSGASSVEGKTMDEQKPNLAGGWGRLEIIKGKSKLYDLLCSPGPNGRCRFPKRVVLKNDVKCFGKECLAGRVISVKIVDSVAKVTRYYTFENTPCVGLTFFDNGKVMSRSASRQQCGNVVTAVGTPVCCRANKPTTYDDKKFGSECLFANEAMDYYTAADRCKQQGSVLCGGGFGRASSEWDRTCAKDAFQWLNKDCDVRIQVYPSGRVTLYDENASERFEELGKSTNNAFRVRWNNDKFPQANKGKCPASCTMEPSVNGDSCLCDKKVAYTQVYTNVPANKEQIERDLFIGSRAPSTYTGRFRYELCQSDACKRLTGVKVWNGLGEPNFSKKTIFELPPFRAGGKTRYLVNARSVVSVGSFSFRNPPHVMPLNGGLQDVPQDWFNYIPLTKAKLEVEMLLDHLFEHDSTAPFVAYRMIQHMVTSNPSPRYMKVVVDAFRTGTYAGQTFSGKYGDLAATTAAVLLDKEARSPALEADPTFGMQRDPLMKIMQFMRSMQYKSRDEREIDISGMQDDVGVQAFRQPSVFGFYLPEFRPPGAISDAGLVSPVTQLATTPYLVSYVNGMMSLIDNGLTYCNEGFGQRYRRGPCGRPSGSVEGWLTHNPSNLNSASDVVEELDLMLTSGRLSAATKNFITDTYKTNLKRKDGETAYKEALKQIVTSVDFQITGVNKRTNEAPEEPTKVVSKNRPFKAVVVVFEAGGADSYNLVVPHSQCPARDLYKHYESVRGEAAVDKNQLLQIDVKNQVCGKFGVHPSMTNLAKLYQDGDAAFLANIGALVEPVTVAEVQKRSKVPKRLPPSLFAHNIMQRSMHNVEAQNVAAKGILGRIFQALTSQNSPFKSDAFSISGNQKTLDGANPQTIVNSRSGINRFSQKDRVADLVANLTDVKMESLFGDNFARLLRDSLTSTEAIGEELAATKLSTTFSDDPLSQQLQRVAELIKMRKFLKSERQVFITQSGGWDTHGTFNLDYLFGGVDSAVGSFAKEMKAQGIWDDVVVLTVSDFGRTMTNNGRGTDHAWGGNHFVAGGSIKGKQMFGTYPDDLSDKSDISLGRGRLVPTSAWESVWIGIAEWLGVRKEKIDQVLPNLSNFPEGKLFRRSELFQN